MKTVMETDICIVAGGPSGLSAAISAAQAGARVILLERTARTGGAGNMAMGLFGIGTRQAFEAGCSLSTEEAFDIFMDYTHYRCDSRLVLKYVSRSKETIEWLEEMGVSFSCAASYFPGSYATWHLVTPPPGMKRAGHAAVMMEKMTQKALSLGVTILTDTRATGLQLQDGHITAVEAASIKNEEILINCKATILCTGGFGGDKEQILKRTGLNWGQDIFSISLPFSRGDGIRMALEIGAMEDRSGIEIMYTTPQVRSDISQCLWRQPKSLVLNIHGERVFNEEYLENTTYTGNIIMQQPRNRVFSIIDSNILKYYSNHARDLRSNVWEDITPEAFLTELKEKHAGDKEGVYIASSPGELAQKTGIRQEKLYQAIYEYNSGCASKEDMFFKSRQHLIPLEGPDYYALMFVPGGYGTLGGIKTDHNMQVLDRNWDPIPGLYAAGTDACSIFGDSYCFKLPGNTLGFCVNSGRFAGEHAAGIITRQ